MNIKKIQIKDSENNNLFFDSVQAVVHGDKEMDDIINEFRKSVFNSLFPIGTIRIFANEYNPNDISPDMTWERCSQGEILYDKNADDPEPEDCSYSVQITESTMPRHNHAVPYRNSNASGSNNYDNTVSANGAEGTLSSYNLAGATAHNNMMPYIAYNIWRRIS